MAPDHDLRRELSFLDLVFLGMGAIIGSGIFMIPGLAAGLAGPLSILIWALVGVAAIAMSLVIAELAARFRDAGGPYTYVRAAFGDLAGFVVAWLSCVISWITISMLVAAAMEYLAALAPIQPPLRPLFSILLLAALVRVNAGGVRRGASLQSFLTGLALVVLTALAAIAATRVEVANLLLLELPGAAALAASLLIVVEPFIGWEALTFLAEEAAKPALMPSAIVVTTVGVTAVYCLVAFTALGAVPSSELGASSAPLSLMAHTALGPAMGPLASAFISLVAFLVMVGTANSWVLASSRLPYSMARRGHLPSLLAEVNGQGVPTHAMHLQLAVSSALLLWGRYEALLHLLVPLALVLYLAVALAHPAVVRRLGRVPGYRPAVPVWLSLACAAAALGALAMVGARELALAALVLASGLGLYAGHHGYLYISGGEGPEAMPDEEAAAPQPGPQERPPDRPPTQGDGRTAFILFVVLCLGALGGIGLALGFMYATGRWTLGLEIIVGIVEVVAIVPLVLLLYYFVYQLELTEFKRIKDRFMELEEIFEKIERQYADEEKVIEKEVVFLKDEESALHDEIAELKESVLELKKLFTVERSLERDVERLAREEGALESDEARLVADERALGGEVRRLGSEERELAEEIAELREAIGRLRSELRVGRRGGAKGRKGA